MGLMDKVKAQASQLAQKTQDAASTGMAKFDAAQMARRYDPLLKSLGLAVLADRTGRGGPDSAAQIDQLITSLTQFEAQNSVNIVDHAAQAGQAQPGGGQFLSSTPPPGDPNLQATPAAAGFPGAAPSTGFPEAAPSTGFPQAAPPSGFPEAAPPSPGFPEAAPSTGFPQAAPPPGFPEAAPPGFPEAAPPPGFPEAAPSPGFPPAEEEPPGGPPSFPPPPGS